MLRTSVDGKTFLHCLRQFSDIDDGVLQSRLIAYASQQAHSSAERAALLGGVKVRLLEIDEDFSLRGEALQRAIDEDRAKVISLSFVVQKLL